MSPEMQHQTNVQFQPAWNEWLASCTCGWVGSYLKLRSQAKREAEFHVHNINEGGQDV